MLYLNRFILLSYRYYNNIYIEKIIAENAQMVVWVGWLASMIKTGQMLT